VKIIRPVFLFFFFLLRCGMTGVQGKKREGLLDFRAAEPPANPRKSTNPFFGTIGRSFRSEARNLQPFFFVFLKNESPNF
jgi:hypothetical protein